MLQFEHAAMNKMFIRLIKIDMFVNDHWWSDSQFYILLHSTVHGTSYYDDCVNLWEFYALDVGDLSIENFNTAVADSNESRA